MGQCIVARLLEYNEKWLFVITTQYEATQLCLIERNIKRMNLVFVPWGLNVFKNLFCSSCRQMGRRISDVPLFQGGQTCRSTYNWDTRRNASSSLLKFSVMLVLFYHLTSQIISWGSPQYQVLWKSISPADEQGYSETRSSGITKRLKS